MTDTQQLRMPGVFPFRLCRSLLHGSKFGGYAGVTLSKAKSRTSQTCPEAFQNALDALDVIGRWELDATTDRVRVDAFVALLFNFDPEEAEDGIPLTSFVDSIHAEDRARVLAQIRRSALEGGAYLAEYRVHSFDGQTRWVLARGRFNSDHAGRSLGGRGILVDITRMRMSEGTVGEAETDRAESSLERAVEHVLAARQAVVELSDLKLKLYADALLMALGYRLARQELRERHRTMN